MLPSPQLAALSQTAAVATRRAAATASSVAARRLFNQVRSLSSNLAVTSCPISLRRWRYMPQEEDRATCAPLPLQDRSFAVAVGSGDSDGEAPALAVVSFYRFADFPDHAAFRKPLKELCEERVSAQISLVSRCCWL
jgi:hypothetical protein